MQGLGFLIWKLNRMPPVEQLVTKLKKYGTKWICIKVADGVRRYNQTESGDLDLRLFLERIRAAGIEVGGWHWVYPQRARAQGECAVERCKRLGLDHYLLDVEYNWKKDGGTQRAATELVDCLDLEGVQFGFCSYRYPSYHRKVPYKQFLGHKNMHMIAPQVYWVMAHNPRQQIERSLSEYRTISDKPFVPIGSMFTRGVPGSPGCWSPTAADISQFVQTCRDEDFKAYGFYSLDEVIRHNRQDWLEAVAGENVQAETRKSVRVTVDNLNIRRKPLVMRETDFGNLHKGAELNVLEDLGEWLRVEGYVWKRSTQGLSVPQEEV